MKKNKIILAAVLAQLAVVACFVFSDPVSGNSVWSLAAFTPCLSTLADSISQDCDNPRVSGYEDTALIFNRNDIDWSSVTTDANNPRIITSFSLKEGKTPYVIYNPRVNPAPFNGSNTSFTQDTSKYTKTVQFYYEGIGGAASMNVVEPLANGSYIVLLQRKDHRGDGSFQLVGYQSGLVATAQVQDEETGYWLMTMNTDEPFADVAYLDTDYATTKAAFDSMLTLVP